jgi:hypothetical protein
VSNKQVFVQVDVRHEGNLVPGEWVSTIEAIHRMQNAIAELRRMGASSFDPSFGEQPAAILAPSEEEAAVPFLKRAIFT